MRLFTAILIGILALFQYDFWFGKNGYLDYKEIAAKIIENKTENEDILHYFILQLVPNNENKKNEDIE